MFFRSIQIQKPKNKRFQFYIKKNNAQFKFNIRHPKKINNKKHTSNVSIPKNILLHHVSTFSCRLIIIN